MKQRTITSIFILLGLALLLVSRMLTPLFFDFGLGALAVIGAVEVARAFERSGRYSNIIMASIYPAILYVGLCLGFKFSWNWIAYLGWIIGSLIVYTLLIFLVGLTFKNRTKQEMNNKKIENISYQKFALIKAMNTSMVLIYPTMLFMCLIMINHMNVFKIFVDNEIVLNSNLDYFLLVATFATTMLTDSFAMIVGSVFKGPKLCPIISPKKTISGAIGGLCGGMIGATGTFGFFLLNNGFRSMYEALNLNIWYFIFFGFVGSVLCQLGDIFASYIKRKARIKDYGTIFPGHGGVMDRVDGLIFVSVFALIFLFILA